MAKQIAKIDQTNQEITTKDEPRGLSISEKGIRTGSQFAAFMSAIMADVYAGRVSPGVSNAAVNAGGKLLKVVEMQMKYGVQGKGQDKTLSLIPTEFE